MSTRQIRTIFFRIVAILLLLSLVAIGIFSYKTLNSLGNQIVYFVKSEDNHFSLQAVVRNSESKALKDKLVDAMEFLIAGPKENEKNQGLATNFFKDTKLLSLKIIADEVSVDFSNEFLHPQGISALEGLINQVFYTLSQANSINKVRLLVDGSPLNYIGGEGIIVDQPWIKTSDNLPKW